jgi:hypothetical protein
MYEVSFLSALIAGGVFGLAVYCGVSAAAAWRRRNAASSTGFAKRGTAAARALLAGAAVLAILGLIARETVPRDGRLRAEDVFAVRATQDMRLSYLTDELEIEAGEILARFEAPESEAAINALRIQRDVLQAERDALKALPVELDPELIRRHQRHIVDLRQYQDSMNQLVPALQTLRRLQLEDRLEKEEKIRAVELAIARRRDEMAQERAKLAYIGDVDKATQSLVQRKAAASIRASKSASDRRICEAQMHKLQSELNLLEKQCKLLQAERDEYDTLLTRQRRELMKKVERTREALQIARQQEKTGAKQLERDYRRACRQRALALAKMTHQIEKNEAELSALQRTLTIHAPFSGKVLYRSAAPKMEYDEAPLLVLGTEAGIVARVRVPASEAAALQESAEAILETKEAAVERRFSGRIRHVQPMPHEENYVVAELLCQPPNESIQELGQKEPVPVRLRWRPPIHTQPLLVGAGTFALMATAVGVWSYRRKRAVIAQTESSRPTVQPEATEAPAIPLAEAAETGHDGVILRTLGQQLRRSVIDGENVPADVVSAIEWALDRHHTRAVRLIGKGLHDGDRGAVVDRAREIWHRQPQDTAAETGTADHARRTQRILRVLLPELAAEDADRMTGEPETADLHASGGFA